MRKLLLLVIATVLFSGIFATSAYARHYSCQNKYSQKQSYSYEGWYNTSPWATYRLKRSNGYYDYLKLKTRVYFVCKSNTKRKVTSIYTRMKNGGRVPYVYFLNSRFLNNGTRYSTSPYPYRSYNSYVSGTTGWIPNGAPYVTVNKGDYSIARSRVWWSTHKGGDKKLNVRSLYF